MNETVVIKVSVDCVMDNDELDGWNGTEHSVGGDWISLGEREMASLNYVDENTLSTSTSFDKSGSTFPEIEENRASSEVEQSSHLFPIFPALDRSDCGVLSKDSMNNSESNSQQIVQPPEREKNRTFKDK